MDLCPHIGFTPGLTIGRAFRISPPGARPSLCALEALRTSVCRATMTTPGGAGTVSE